MSPYAYVLPLVIWGGTLAVCVLCVYVAWRGLFGDRGAGKRRCPKCWYDMAYSPGMTCGECGRTAQNEREFTRTRRRPFVAFSAVFICVVLVLGVNDQMNQRGMLRHVPSGLLIFSLPVTGGMDSRVGREIDRRMTQQKLTAAQGERLIRRCAEGDWLSAPPSKSWIANYGNFIINWRNRFIGDAAIETPLLAIPPRLEATTRESWPEQVPIVVSVRLEDWWPAGMECRVRAVPRLADASAKDTPLEPITFYRGGETRFRPSPFAMYLPPLPAGEHEIIIDYHVDRRRMEGVLPASASASTAPDDNSLAAANAESAEGAWESVGTFSTSMKTRIDGSLAAVFKPAVDPELDAALAQVFGNAVRWAGGGRSPVRFGINAPVTFVAPFNDVAVGVSVELVRNNEIARRLNLWWIGGDNIDDDQRNYGFEINYENIDLLRLLEADTIESDGWQLRVKADPTIALRAGPAAKFWQGEVLVPINLRTTQTVAPPRMWWTDGEALQEPKPEAEPSRSRRGRSA